MLLEGLSVAHGFKFGKIDCAGALLLTKNEEAVRVRHCNNIRLENIVVYGCIGGAAVKLRTTWSAIKFIWST